jgi:hypothetical protein
VLKTGVTFNEKVNRLKLQKKKNLRFFFEKKKQDDEDENGISAKL